MTISRRGRRRAQAAPHAARQIVRRVAHRRRRAAVLRPRARPVGVAQVRVISSAGSARAQRLDQHRGGLHLTDRDRVHPDAAARARADRNRIAAASRASTRASRKPRASTTSDANGSARYSSSV